MNKYEQTTEKKKSAIIQSALSLFCTRGFTDISIKEISLQAHVSQASIYNYFGSKETLVTECVKVVLENIRIQATEYLKEDIDFKTKLIHALSLCSEGFHLSISNYVSKQAMKDTVFVNLLFKNANTIKKNILEQYIELGKSQNVLDCNIPTKLYLNFFEALNSLGTNPEFYDDLENNTANIHKLFLYGLLGK